MRGCALIAGLALPLVLAGCGIHTTKITHVAPTPTGPAMTREAVTTFRPGVTTADDAIHVLGPPAGDVALPDGGRKLTYTYGQVTPRWMDYLPILSAFSVPGDKVALRFGHDGTLTDIQPPP